MVMFFSTGIPSQKGVGSVIACLEMRLVRFIVLPCLLKSSHCPQCLEGWSDSVHYLKEINLDPQLVRVERLSVFSGMPVVP